MLVWFWQKTLSVPWCNGDHRVIDEPSSPQIAAAIVELKGSNTDLADATTAWLRSTAEAKDGLLAHLNGEAVPAVTAPGEAPLKELEDLAADLTTAATSIDATQFTKTLADIVAKKNEIEVAKRLRIIVLTFKLRSSVSAPVTP
jgi:hypothetical protein